VFRRRGLCAGRLCTAAAIISVFASIVLSTNECSVERTNPDPIYREEVSVNIVNLMVIVALVATVVVLGLGLQSMVRGGTYDMEHSEKFMWERIALQTLAIILLVAATYLMNT
jgi:uncharacterized BrkB/YihY/UPF0761 family membrane protein